MFTVVQQEKVTGQVVEVWGPFPSEATALDWAADQAAQPLGGTHPLGMRWHVIGTRLPDDRQ